MGDLLEGGVGGILENEGEAATPRFDEVEALEEAADNRVSAVGDVTGAKVVDGETFWQRTWVPDFDTVREDGDADLVGIAVIAVTEGIDDGLAEGGGGDFGDVHANEPFEAHADADVAEDVSFSLLNEGG